MPASSDLSSCESAPKTEQISWARALQMHSWLGMIGTILRVQFTQQVEEMGRLWPPPRAWSVLLEAAWNARSGGQALGRSMIAVAVDIRGPQSVWHSRCGALCVLSVASAVLRELAGSIIARPAETPPSGPPAAEQLRCSSDHVHMAPSLFQGWPGVPAHGEQERFWCILLDRSSAHQ